MSFRETYSKMEELVKTKDPKKRTDKVANCLCYQLACKLKPRHISHSVIVAALILSIVLASYPNLPVSATHIFNHPTLGHEYNNINPYSENPRVQEMLRAMGGPTRVEAERLLDTSTSTVRLDFETGDLSQWNADRTQVSGTTDPNPLGRCAAYVQQNRMEIVENNVNNLQPMSPDPNSQYLLKTTVEPDDRVNNGNRAEIAYCYIDSQNEHKRFYFEEGDEVWYRWYTMFPNSFSAQTNTGDRNLWHVWTQLHQPGNYTRCGPERDISDRQVCSGVPLEFTDHKRGADYRIGMNVMDNDIIERGPSGNSAGDVHIWQQEDLTTDHWYKILLHVKWSTDPNVGLVELWVDDQWKGSRPLQTLDDDLPETSYPDNTVYLAQGL